MPAVQFVRPESLCLYTKFQLSPQGYSLNLCPRNDGVEESQGSLPSFCILWSPDQQTGSFQAEHLEPSSKAQGPC